MKLTRKGFETLAKAVSKIKNEVDRVTVVQALLPELYKSNPRFDAVRFCEMADTRSLI